MQLFNNVTVLEQIGPARLAKFLNEFNPDLAEINISIPTPDSDNGSYFDSVAAILSNPSLPRRLREAIAALETAAAPENQNRIADAIARRLQCVAISTSCPLDRVLELWFQARDELQQFQSLVTDPTIHQSINPTIQSATEVPKHGNTEAPNPSDSTIQPFNDSTPSSDPTIHQSINPTIQAAPSSDTAVFESRRGQSIKLTARLSSGHLSCRWPAGCASNTQEPFTT